MLNNKLLFSILLFSLTGLLLPPTFSQIDIEEHEMFVFPSAYATSLKPIEKAYAYKIALIIKIEELQAELQELRENRPQDLVYPNGSPLPGVLNALVYNWEHDIEQLEIEIKNAEINKEKICDGIDNWELYGQDDRTLNLILDKTKGIDDIIDISQSATMLYINIIGGIFNMFSGDSFDLEIFCEMLELAIKAAEAVGDDEAVEELEEIAIYAETVKETKSDYDGLKKKFNDYKDKLEKAKTLLEGDGDGQTSIPPWIKSNADWWSKGLISDRDFATGLGFMVQSGIIQVENVPINAEGSVALSDNLSIPNWIRTNAEWWASGAISDNDFKSGIQFMIAEEVISFEEKLSRDEFGRPTDSDARDSNAGAYHLEGSVILGSIFEIAKQNELTMTYLQKIKFAEYEILNDACDTALKEYSENQNQSSMNNMSTLCSAEKTAKQELELATQIHKTSVRLAENAKYDAIKSGLHVSDLEKSVSKQQSEIDSMNNKLETESEIESANKNAKKSLGEKWNLTEKGELVIFLVDIISKENGELEFLKWYASTQSSDPSIPSSSWNDPSVPFSNPSILIFSEPGETGDIFVQPFSTEAFDDVAEYYTIDVALPDGSTITVLQKTTESTLGSVLDPLIIEGFQMLDDDFEPVNPNIGWEDFEPSYSTDPSEPIENPCLMCGEEITDENQDGKCDTCDAEITVNLDNSKCDVCGEHFEDKDTDLACDACGTNIDCSECGLELGAEDGTCLGCGEEVSHTTENEDGSITTYYPDGSTATTYPDGKHITTFEDGTKIISYPDGTSTKIFPDGTFVNFDQNGNEITETTSNEKTRITNSDGTVTIIYPDGTNVWLTNAGSKATITYTDGTVERTSVGFNFSGGGVQVKIGTSTWNFDTHAEAYAAVEGIVDEYLSGAYEISGPYDPNHSYTLPVITADYGRQYPAYQFTIVKYTNTCDGEKHYISNGALVGATTLSLGGYMPVGNCGFGTVSDYPIQNLSVEGSILNAYLNHLGLNSFPPVPEDTSDQTYESEDDSDDYYEDPEPSTSYSVN